MLKTIMQSLLHLCFYTAALGHCWEFEQNVTVEGVLRRAERTITKNPHGKKETKVEKSIVLVADNPLVLSRTVTIGKQQIASTATSYPHIEVCLPEEFIPLIGMRVQCYGNFKRSFDFSGDEIFLDINTALDSMQPTHQLKTLSYEPEEVEVSGLLHKIVYPGPPDYVSVETGDRPEKAIILTLKSPINVETKGDDNFNEPEKGVRELQVVFSDSSPTANQMKEEIVLKGTLFHAHTAHHHRRVLMMVKDWNVNK